MANFFGTDGPDILTGAGGNDYFEGKGAADKIYGGKGNDTLKGGLGDDVLYGGAGDDLLYDSSSDPFKSGSDQDRLYGGAGNDTLISYQAISLQDRDELYGGAGDDLVTMLGMQTGDKADGGTGFDTLSLTTGLGETAPGKTIPSVTAFFSPTQFIVQLDGSDAVFATNFERLFITTGKGTDNISGGKNDDLLRSIGGGFDTLRGKGGDDLIVIDLSDAEELLQKVVLAGGKGSDTLVWRTQKTLDEAIVFNLKDGVYTRNGKALGQIKGFEMLEVWGADGDDLLVGGKFADKLFGGDGNNTLKGMNGNDFLRGGSGDDLLIGGKGNDTLQASAGSFSGSKTLLGGKGNDQLIGAGENVTLDGGRGNDTYVITGGETLRDAGGRDIISVSGISVSLDMRGYGFIEDLVVTGTSGSATITGNALNNVIRGGAKRLTADGDAGNDRIFGSRYTDELQGGKGKDRLFGNEGNDTLSGNGGRDRLNGGSGDDLLKGGNGNDVLLGREGHDVLKGGKGNDILRADTNATVDSGIGFGAGKLTKAASDGASKEMAVSLDDMFILKAHPNVISSQDVPHVTVRATMGGMEDWYAVTVKAGTVITVDVDRGGNSGSLPNKIIIYNADGLSLSPRFTFNKDDPGSTKGVPDAFQSITVLEAGTYYIVIEDDSYQTIRTGDGYLLHVSIGDLGGNDTLDGGKGRDVLTGGRGQDVFLFKKGYGKDTITDFQDDIDTIRLDDGLWTGKLNKQQVINKFADVVGDDIIFDFGKHELKIKGFTDLAELKDDIEII